MNTYGIVYCIENTINNHKYIGQTIRTLEERVSEHFKSINYKWLQDRAIYKAMSKYGIENFISYQLDSANCQEELDTKESYWIDYYNTFLGRGYNMTGGGQLEKRNYENIDISNKMSEMFGGREFMIFDINGNYIKSTISQTLLSEELNCATQSINNCLTGIKTQVKGHILIFKDEFNDKLLGEILKRYNMWKKSFVVIDFETGKIIGNWQQKQQCANELNISVRTIQRQLNFEKDKIRPRKGYIFKYINEEGMYNE